MKTDNKSTEQYVAPKMTDIEILPEGIICDSNIESPGMGDDM